MVATRAVLHGRCVTCRRFFWRAAASKLLGMALNRTLTWVACSALLASCGDDGTPADDTTEGATTAPTGGSDSSATNPGTDTNPPTTGDSSDSGNATDPDDTGPVFMECGNGIVEGSERCDGENFDGWTCETQGFDGGVLSCRDDCDKLITEECFFFFCGNGSIQGGEVCDLTDTADETCITQGFESGILSCNANCSEFDTSTCGVCGNSVIDGADVCDTGELAGEDCESQGFEYGTLACNSTCDGYDTVGCGLCGDNSLGGSEACDGPDLGGATCAALGLGGGTLGCQASCSFDVSLCDIQGGSLVTVRITDGMLRAYNIIQGTFSDIGPIGYIPNVLGLTYDPGTATTYLVDGANTFNLYTVNTATGQATSIGNHGDFIGGAAYHTSNGAMYAADGIWGFTNFYFEINTATAASTQLGTVPAQIDGLTYDVTRNALVGIDCGNSGQIYEINPLTGQGTLLASPGFANICGFAYEPINDLYWSIDWSGNLYNYDPNAGYTRTLVLSNQGQHDGLVYVPGLVL